MRIIYKNHFVSDSGQDQDKLDILKFLFKSELKHYSTDEFWGRVHFETKRDAIKMVKRIVKALK